MPDNIEVHKLFGGYCLKPPEEDPRSDFMVLCNPKGAPVAHMKVEDAREFSRVFQQYLNADEQAS